MQKTVYWDLINSNMNKRDVQTDCSGLCIQSSNTGDENMDVLQLTILEVYETGFVLRSL